MNARRVLSEALMWLCLCLIYATLALMVMAAMGHG